jgi:hypothetical protein
LGVSFFLEAAAFLGAAAAFFGAAGLAAVFATRPDLVLVRTVGLSTTAGAAGAWKKVSHCLRQTDRDMSGWGSRFTFLGAAFFSFLGAAAFFSLGSFLAAASFLGAAAFLVAAGLAAFFSLVSLVSFLAAVSFLGAAAFLGAAGFAAFLASLVPPEGPVHRALGWE